MNKEDIMKINYNKPTNYDKRRRAGFWVGAGSFITSSAIMYAITLIASFFFVIAGTVKLFCK